MYDLSLVYISSIIQIIHIIYCTIIPFTILKINIKN